MLLPFRTPILDWNRAPHARQVSARQVNARQVNPPLDSTVGCCQFDLNQMP